MNFTPKLKKQEKRIIKKVARLQLESLSEILNRKSSENVDLYCAMNEIDITKFDEAIKKEMGVFENLLINPQSFINLSEVNILLIKHLMENFITQKSLSEYKSLIWRKFNLREQFHIYTNEN